MAVNRKMRIQKYIINFIAVLILLPISGCWDSKDIQQKDIHISEMIDHKDGNYIFYGEVADLSGKQQKDGDSGNGKSQSFQIVKAAGKNLTQARDELDRKSSMPVYLGACRVLIFSDRMAETGLEEYLNRSRTQHDTRKSLKIMTTAVEPEELFDEIPDNSSSVGLAIEKMSESMIEEGSSFDVDIGDLLEVLAVKRTGFLIPEVGVKDSEITLMGYSVFFNAQKIGFIPADQRKGAVDFLNPKARFSYEVLYKSRKYQLEATLKNKKIKTLYQNGKLNLKVDMNFTAELNYTDKAQPISVTDREQLQGILSNMVKQDIEQALTKSQKEFRSDYLGIYRYFRAEHNSIFKTIDWEKTYAEASADVIAKVIITSSEIPQK